MQRDMQGEVDLTGRRRLRSSPPPSIFWKRFRAGGDKLQLSSTEEKHMTKKQQPRKAEKHRWAFVARFSRRFGWQSKPAVQRVREAVAEIVKEARREPMTAASGAVLFLEKVAPAIEHVDGSSG